jgi:hypothetical protein
MSPPAPTLEGFRAAFRRPSLALAEIAWRWVVGSAAVVSVIFLLIEYTGTLRVSGSDANLIATAQPLLVLRAFVHIIRGTLSRAALAAVLGAVAFSLLWVVAASIGRAVTGRALLDYFRSSPQALRSFQHGDHWTAFRALLTLNFWRVAGMLAALLSFAGAAIIAGLVSPEADPQPTFAFFVLVLLTPLICIAWSQLNWLLSVASVFAIRDGEDALSSVSAAVTFLRERPGPILAVSLWNALARIVAFVGASIFALLLVAFLHGAPARVIIGGSVLVAVAYFAFVDWLYIARLAGYICIVEMPNSFVPQAISSLAIPPSALPGIPTGVPSQTAIDCDELIVSDLPDLA